MPPSFSGTTFRNSGGLVADVPGSVTWETGDFPCNSKNSRSGMITYRSAEEWRLRFGRGWQRYARSIAMFRQGDTKNALAIIDTLTRDLPQSPYFWELKGNLLLGLESSTARMANLARQEMYFHQFFTVDELIARVDEVNAAQVQAMAQRLFNPEQIAVALLGRLNGVKLNREMLAC